MGRVFANGPGDLGSISGRVIPKTFKMVLDTSLLNTQQYKVRIKGKVEQSRERSSTLPDTLVEKGAFGSPSTTVANFTLLTTPRCRGGRYSFSWIAPLYPWSVPYNAVLSKEASSTIFWVFGMTQPGIEPRSPGPLVNTLTAGPMSGMNQ